MNGVKTMNNRAYVEWVNIMEILPNPLNPRKNDAIKSEDLQKTIKKRGWETPITAYKKGSVYVVLSGHRRLFAARAAGMKSIPVFVVDQPKSHQEEIERIANVQQSVDWTALEWARFCYERWLAWGKPGIEKFAKEINIPTRTVQTYVRVLDYFPMEEIESGLNHKIYSISALEDIYEWLHKVKKLHPKTIEMLSEEMVRRLMLEKWLNKRLSRETLRRKDFLEKVKAEDLREFFLDKTYHLQDLMAKYEFDITAKTFNSQLISMGHAKKAVKNMSPKSREEAKKSLQVIKELQESADNQLKYLLKKYPDLEKDDLFNI